MFYVKILLMFPIMNRLVMKDENVKVSLMMWILWFLPCFIVILWLSLQFMYLYYVSFCMAGSVIPCIYAPFAGYVVVRSFFWGRCFFKNADSGIRTDNQATRQVPTFSYLVSSNLLPGLSLYLQHTMFSLRYAGGLVPAGSFQLC